MSNTIHCQLSKFKFCVQFWGLHHYIIMPSGHGQRPFEDDGRCRPFDGEGLLQFVSSFRLCVSSFTRFVYHYLRILYIIFVCLVLGQNDKGCFSVDFILVKIQLTWPSRHYYCAYHARRIRTLFVVV